MIWILNKLQDMLDATRVVDFLGPLALRLYLVPVFWMGGTQKFFGESLGLADLSKVLSGDKALELKIQNIAGWFGNPDWGLGLPAPELMAWLAAGSELLGAVLLLFGLAVRWISVPLMVTMVVAGYTVHWAHGWAAIADSAEASQRLTAAKSLLQEHGNYNWLTGSGDFVILNNGIEFATTYFIMLLVLFFIGAGKYLSLDHWIAKGFRN